MQFERAFAVAGFQVRQIVLCNANCRSEFCLGLFAKLSQHPYRIFTIRKTIDDALRQHRCTARDLSLRSRNQPRGAQILLKFLFNSFETLILRTRYHRHFALRRRLEFYFHHVLLIVDLAPVTNRYNYDRFGLLVKDHTPVADPEPRTRLTFQLLDVAMARCCKGIEFLTDTLPDLRRKLQPLARCSRGKPNLRHDKIYRTMRYICPAEIIMTQMPMRGRKRL